MAEATAKTSDVIVPHEPLWHQRVAAFLVWFFIRAVSLTLRYKWIDRAGFFSNPPVEPAIYSIWHNRLALSMILLWDYAKKRNRTPGIAAIVSASKDGALMACALENFGMKTVRGSTSRRGPQALREMTTWARRGYDLALTPDGPRGPRYVVQDGVIALAQLTGLPIVPMSFHVHWKYCLKSWDRFQIPLPFSRCEMYFDAPIRVPREASPAEREAIRLAVEKSMMSISED